MMFQDRALTWYLNCSNNHNKMFADIKTLIREFKKPKFELQCDEPHKWVIIWAHFTS